MRLSFSVLSPDTLCILRLLLLMLLVVLLLFSFLFLFLLPSLLLLSSLLLLWWWPLACARYVRCARALEQRPRQNNDPLFITMLGVEGGAHPTMALFGCFCSVKLLFSL